MKHIIKTLALILALAMIMTLAIGCNPEPEEEATPPPVVDTTTPEATPAPTPEPDPQTLMVGYADFSQKFSPFFATTAYDVDVADMTQIYLIGNDRAGGLILNGIEGEVVNYNGTDYTYYTPANISIDQKSNGTVEYNITIRDDLLFSDGKPVTIDDLIFTMYVYADPTYDGSTTLYSMPITGMNSYRTGVNEEIFDKYETLGWAIVSAGRDNSNFSDWDEDLQDAFWGYFDEAGVKFTQEIVSYCVANYSAYLGDVGGSEVALGMYAWGFGEPTEDGTFITYVLEDEYDIANGNEPTVEDYWNEILEAYGDGLDDINYESAGTSMQEFMVSAFISGEGPKDPEAGGVINNIAGIKKTGDYSLTVTTDYFEATSIYQLALPLAPLHYYGDPAQFDYDNDMFGFPKGDLSIVREKTTVPMGAGAYKYLSYEAGVVSFEANENYYKGEPKIKYIRFQETPDVDKLSGIVSGSFDITDPSFNQTTVDSIKEYNSNGELTGDLVTTVTVDNLGYGYIGMNAETVNVGGDPGSQESKWLRLGFATVWAVYRETVNNSYYGDRAQTIQYPISNTSWAAPRPNDEGYRVAYSRDVDGNDIYTDTMSEVEKYAAALQAAIGFFKAAGYTWDEGTGTFTAAPAGASLVYEAIVIADGIGDHPAYGVFTAVKESLATIGITIEIVDTADGNVLWNALDAGTQEMWAAAWQATIDPDMYQVYHSTNITGRGGTDSNNYGVDDPELDRLIIEARSSDNQAFRKATYKQCLDIVMDWAVEIPNYQRNNAVIFSTERVNMDTVTPDITTFWGWANDIEKLEMN